GRSRGGGARSPSPTTGPRTPPPGARGGGGGGRGGGGGGPPRGGGGGRGAPTSLAAAAASRGPPAVESGVPSRGDDAAVLIDPSGRGVGTAHVVLNARGRRHEVEVSPAPCPSSPWCTAPPSRGPTAAASWS